MLAVAFAALALIACLAAFTLLRTRAIEARFPPRGEFVPLAGGAIHLREVAAIGAERATVLLIHGASGTHADMFNALGAPLATQGFKTIAVDRPGHGWSSRFAGRKASSPEVQAELIRQALAGKGVDQAIVVGHSLAGIVALAMTLNAPQFVRGLVLLAPVSHPWPGGVAIYYRLGANRWIGGAFRRLLVFPIGQLMLPGGMAAVFAPNPAPAGYAEATGLALVLRPAHYKANAEDVFDAKANVAALCPRYGEIRAPTAIVTGNRDGVVYPQIHSAGCARDIQGAILTTLDGIGHSPHYSASDAAIAAILDTAKRVEAREATAQNLVMKRPLTQTI